MGIFDNYPLLKMALTRLKWCICHQSLLYSEISEPAETWDVPFFDTWQEGILPVLASTTSPYIKTLCFIFYVA